MNRKKYYQKMKNYNSVHHVTGLPASPSTYLPQVKWAIVMNVYRLNVYRRVHS